MTVRDTSTEALKNHIRRDIPSDPMQPCPEHCLAKAETTLTSMSFRRRRRSKWNFVNEARSLLEDMKAIIVGGEVKKITF